jgi:uncharacterized membrane protein
MGDRWGSGRVEAFSDGVFSIAATLLVLELNVPESQFGDLPRGIAHQWPGYLAYATSFLTIGGLWLVHHGMFRRLALVDYAVMRLNLGLLMVVAFLPYPTKLVAGAIHDSQAERAAVIFYGATLLAISVLVSVIWRYVARHRELLEPGVTDHEVAAIEKAATPDMLFYAGVIVLGIVAPKVAAVGYLVIALVAVMRTRSPVPQRDTRAGAA